MAESVKKNFRPTRYASKALAYLDFCDSFLALLSHSLDFLKFLVSSVATHIVTSLLVREVCGSIPDPVKSDTVLPTALVMRFGVVSYSEHDEVMIFNFDELHNFCMTYVCNYSKI